MTADRTTAPRDGHPKPSAPLGDGPDALRASRSDTISVGLRAGGDQGRASRPSPGEQAAAESAGGGGPPGSRGRSLRPGAGQIPPLEIWVRVNLEDAGGG